MEKFEQEYNKLNKAQREAVDFIDGPVMVVAGPGTGKTQILAIRIGNILKKTDTKGDSILCLTFTNSGVRAMKDRLRQYIGPEASKVSVATFHSFGMEIVEKYYSVLGFDTMPKILDEKDAVAICDKILHQNDWEYIRPRSDATRYFNDLKSLISILKRERITAREFEKSTKDAIYKLENDPESVSSRGATKGELKKDIKNKIEGLSRTLEAIRFYELYEEEKKEKSLFDFDDVLESLVKIVEESDEVRDFIKIEYQYILIDEHQDSSGVQNEFLKCVWGNEEKPNIFVVGDDRQLIYGFGGASLEYFENFKHSFGKAKLITLVENYRSTQNILDSAHMLLESSITTEKLKSNHKESHPLYLVEASYPRDEIISCAISIQEKIKKGENPNDMAILVPKNKQVRSAMLILRDMGIPVAGADKLNFFDQEETQSFLRVLKIIADPLDAVAVTESFFDKYSGISPIEAHKFFKMQNMRNFSILDFVDEEKQSLFRDENPVKKWIEKIKSWIALSRELDLHSLVQKIGSDLLVDNAKDHEELVARIEIIRTLLHLVLSQTEKDSKLRLNNFIEFLDRLESYGEHIPLAVFSRDKGVKVLTLHGSKGLEFDYVWIAHMDEKSLGGSKHYGFSLPDTLEDRLEKKDEEVLKRQLFVAITRAKRFCTLSYSLHSYSGGELELASIVRDLEGNFTKQSAEETEEIILKHDPRAYTENKVVAKEDVTLEELQKLVSKDYTDRRVSVSLLNNFFECPWKWYFRNLLQLPESKTDSLEFGNSVHSAVDKILKMSKKPTEKEILNLVSEDKEVFKIVSRWVDSRLKEINKNRENEKSVSVKDSKFPHLNIYGKIDLVEYLDKNSLKVTDFKTGSVRKKSEIEKIDDEGRMSSYLRQLAMYSYLLTESSKNKSEVVGSRLEFLEAKDPKEFFYDRVVSQEEIDLLVKDIKDYDKLIKEGSWTNRPCHFNSYGKNIECEYCSRAKIYK